MRKTKFFGISLRSNWRIAFWLTVGLLLLFAVTPRGYAQALDTASAANEDAPAAQVSFPYKKKFIISSYYSPLPGQSRYFTGSYEGDVRLNGEGVHAADGTQVYPGMAAASRDYPFGTKMEVPGFGIVSIHDRGGAIKGNRLDIWVGSGEEGLARALGWGMRTLEVTVYGVDPNIPESVNFTEVPRADLSRILTPTKHFVADLGFEDEGQPVRELQRYLKQFGFFNGEVTGYFGDETQAAVQRFQLDQGVITSADDTGAGNFGPRSRVALESLLEREKDKALAHVPQPTLKKGDFGDGVKNLQNLLMRYGFLEVASNEATGGFDDATVSALLRFQIDTGVVAREGDRGAGFYGPKTKQEFEKMVIGEFTPQTSLSLPSQDSSPLASKAANTAFGESLSFGGRGEEVRQLQEELARLNFLALAPTGYYGKTTEHAVFKFQQAMGIVATPKDEGAGVTGPNTLAKLNELAVARGNQKQLIATVTETKQIVEQRLTDERNLVAGTVPAEAFLGDLTYGMRGQDVERLQKVLKRLGFFPGRLTTQYFGDITKRSLIAFQNSHNLEQTGALDAKTRVMMNQIIGGSQSS